MARKLKVLFCSPYLHGSGIVPGGIGIWGKAVLDYYYAIIDSQVELMPISFDRKRKVGEADDYGMMRFYDGIVEISQKCMEVKKAMQSYRPDVLHLCTSASLGLLKDFLLLRLAKKRKIKTVLHLHFGRVPYLKNQKNWEWKLLLLVLKLCDSIIVMDKKTYCVLRNEDLKNVVYVPNPLSLEIIDKVKELGGTISRNPRQLLFVGNVLRTKGVFELVDGCVEIKDVKLRLVGKISPEIKAELQRIAQKRGSAEWVSFKGEMSHDDVLKELMAADVFVFPSYTEGFPNVILEAMACGCSIAASNVGAIPEMLNINEDACGVCFASKDTMVVRNAVTKLLESPELKESMALKAYKRVMSQYSIPMVWKLLVSVWQG